MKAPLICPYRRIFPFARAKKMPARFAAGAWTMPDSLIVSPRASAGSKMPVRASTKDAAAICKSLEAASMRSVRWDEKTE